MKRFVAALVAWGFAVGAPAFAAPPPADLPAAAALLDAVKADLKRASALYTESGDYVGVLAACRLALTKLEAYRSEWGDQARARSYGAHAQLLSGFAEEKSGHVRAAIAAYRTYLERYPEAPAASREEAATSLGQLELLGFLMPQLTPTNAVIEIDGAVLEPDATGRIALAPGRHAIVVRAPAFLTSRQFVTVASGEDLALTVALASDGWYAPVAWTAVGVGGAALTAGIVCFIVAQRNEDKVEGAKVDGVIPVGSPMTQSRAMRLWSDRDALHGWGTAGFVTAGVAAATATVFFLLPEGASVEASVAPMDGGALVQLRAGF